MPGLAIDDAAWASPWRDHGLGGKVVLSGGLLAVVLVLPAWPTSLLIALVVTGLVLGPAGTRFSVLLRALKAPLIFIGLSSIAVAVTVQIDPAWSIHVSQSSWAHAAEVCGRAIAGALTVLLLALTTPMTDIMSGLRRAGVPSACVEVASLMYRMLFMLLDTTRTIRHSQAARLGNRSIAQTLRSSGDLTAVILTRSWDQARRLERGLAGRGYTNQLTTLDDPPRTSALFMASITTGLVAIVAIARYSGVNA